MPRIWFFALAAVTLAPLTALASGLSDTAPDCSRAAGDLPRPASAPGTPDPSIPVDHVVVMMLENHSFDNIFGHLSDPEYYGAGVDGLTPGLSNPDGDGAPVEPFHLGKDCVKDMDHSWDGSHAAWNEGRNDGFVRLNESNQHDGYRVMGYYDHSDYPLMYALANQFAVADRYFSSALAPTHPNRFYFYAATSFGRVNNKLPKFLKGGWKQKTIFDALNASGVSWAYYQTDYSNVMLFTSMWARNHSHFKPIGEFARDARAGRLPQVTFIENSTLLGEEHPPMSFETSQKEVYHHLRALVDSPLWERSALFITYDEGGGSYDHVSPPRACEPDQVAPILEKGESNPSRFDRYGFRVPALVVSPWARRHHVSHQVYDHTSILRFIETKYNVPALTARDANADPMLDMFDFGAGPWLERPELPDPPVVPAHLWACLFKKSYR